MSVGDKRSGVSTSADEMSGVWGDMKNRRSYYFVKRVLDITLAVSLIIFLFPVMLLTAITIYIFSPGPVFFTQERVGAKRRSDGETVFWETKNFKCYKFRTMHLNADAAIHKEYVRALISNDAEKMLSIQKAASQLNGKEEETRWESASTGQNAAAKPRKLINDARLIKPGKLLRKFSLDELPQLINVLRGEMSMIGPRPAIPYEVEMYKPWHKLRLQAQPGITGLQQVTNRCTADFDEQVKLDIAYIENQSLWLDLLIALKTPLAVILARGAY